jgi:rubrerythrin
LKIPHLFLSALSKDQKEFLSLLDQTAKVHGEVRSEMKRTNVPVWDDHFFHLNRSEAWKEVPADVKNEILLSLGEKILQEAFFIENAGMAYAAKMNLCARSKEERQFYCFVAEEETKHLRMIEGLSGFNKSLDSIPSFAMLIGEIIQEAAAPSQLLLIQILLEGWGLNYYKTLQKNAKDEAVANVFKIILKDEIRHHSAGVILFNAYGTMSDDEKYQFLAYLERIAFMVKIGPYSVCETLFKNQVKPDRDQLKAFLSETDAENVTAGKMELIGQLISKSLPDDVLNEIKTKEILKPLDINEMTDILFQAMPGIFQPA